MQSSRHARRAPLFVALLGLLALLLPLTLDRAQAAPVVQTVLAGPDFARDAWADAWDMSNADDLTLDRGPIANMSGASISGGVFHVATNRVSFFSLLWGGFPGSIPWGRDGRIAANQIVASSYNRLRLHMYSSAPVHLRLVWFNTCSGCTGYTDFGTKTGWNDIDLSLTGAHTGTAWSGRIMNLRIQVITSLSLSLQVDDVRVYRSNSQGVLHWAAAGSSAAHLFWSDSGTFASSGQHGGQVGTATSSGPGNTVSTDVSAYPPGTRFWAYDGTTAVQVGVSATEPMPVVDSPSVRGCWDYPLAAHKAPWTFTSPSRLSGMGNVVNVSYSSSGEFSATNGGAHPNDPWVTFPLGSTGIDGRTWHRLTIVESYDGPFGLANAPGGGMVGRVYWRLAGKTTWSLTNDLVLPTGKHAITIDMAMPTSSLVEPDSPASMKYPFASTSRVTTLRWDPNEDPGARRWHLFSVVLGEDCRASTTFAVQWHDARFVSGSTVTVQARNAGGTTYTLATGLAEVAGSNTYSLRASRLPANSYTIRVTVRTPAGATHVAGGGPLIIG